MELKEAEISQASHINATLHGLNNQLHQCDFSLIGNITDHPEARLEGGIHIHEDGYYCEGELFIQEEPIAFGVNFVPQKGDLLLPTIELIQGWMRAESLEESTYTPYVQTWAPDIHLGGALSLFVQFDQKKVECSLEGQALSIAHPALEIGALETTGPAIITYDRSTAQITGRLSLGCALLQFHTLDVSLAGVEGFLSIDSTFSQSLNQRTWSFQGGVTHCDVPSGSELEIKGAKWEWKFADNCWSVHNGYAQVQLSQGNSYHVSLMECKGDLSGSAAFDIKIIEACQEFVRCKGTLKVTTNSTTNKIAFHLESEQVKFKDTLIPHLVINGHKIGPQWVIDHIRAKDLNFKTTFSFQDQGVEFGEIEGNWKGYSAKAKGKYLYETQQFFCRIDSLQGELGALTEKCTGRFNACINAKWDVATSTLQGEATCAVDLKLPLSLLVKSETPTHFSYSSQEGWNFQGLSLQLYLFSTSQHLGAVKCAVVQGSSDGFHAMQTGFSLSPELVKRGVAAHLFPEILTSICSKSYLEGSGDLTLTSKDLSFQGKLRDGVYCFQDHLLPLEQILFSFDQTLLSCRFKTLMGEKPLFAKIQIDHREEPFGVIKILDHPQGEGIAALFKTHKGSLRWEKIHGSACGLTLDLVPHPTRTTSDTHFLTGSIVLNGSQLAPYLTAAIQAPFHALKIGSGYAFKGEIEWSRDPKKGYQINGTLLGSQCELFGFTFHNLQAQFDATQDKIFLTNLKIEDESGMLAIKHIDAGKHPHHDTWGFSIPHIQVKEWRPSLHKKKDQTSSQVKPFVIKNLTLSGIRGTVNDPLTWEGEGTLNFTNAFKKESSFLDLPLEVIKNFGLDPGLLTPVQGEVDIELRGDKFYLVHLKNAFSEKKRSQFFLSPESQVSYIGFDGKLSIDLKMRQDVVLKLTEAFTLKVRGTVDRPRYGLQY